MESVSSITPWSSAQKIAFRFFAAYLFIYIFPFPINLAEELWSSVSTLFDPVVAWTGRHVLHLGHDVQNQQNGSGDTTYGYVQIFIYLVVAVAACIIWSVADSKRAAYSRLLYWLTALVRYYLAFFLLVYGYGKFANGQFPEPSFQRLLQPYGESSPMGLAWTFFGFSRGYGIFMGISEAIGGLLILFRRTLLLGACIAATVTMNIVMVNFCYDVPVKLFSVHLFVMAAFIIITHGRRFVVFFILNRPVQPADLTPVLRKRAWKIARLAVKSIYIVLALAYPIILLLEESEAYGNEPRSPLYGVYSVNEFVRNSGASSPAPDSTRWGKLLLEDEGYATIHMVSGKKVYLGFFTDTIQHTATIYSYKDTSAKYRMRYTRKDSVLTLSGVFEKDTLTVKMQQYGSKKFLLVNRGFHWINEFPYNR